MCHYEFSQKSIGILSALLVEFENHPIPAKLTREVVPYVTMQCVAEYAIDLPCYERRLIRRSLKSHRALRKLQKLLFQQSTEFEAKISTTQAIDLINGGVKTNALPESANAVVNHRIAVDRYVLNFLINSFLEEFKLRCCRSEKRYRTRRWTRKEI